MKQRDVAKFIFKGRRKLGNAFLIVFILGIVVFNFFPEAGCFLIGAGFTTGIYIHSRINVESESVIVGCYKAEGKESKTDVFVGSEKIELPSFCRETIDDKDGMKFFSFAIVALPEEMAEAGTEKD
ncbi:hypothetical protein [Puniceicoccus vermicola]|uniref:Uncharacterized protein n=1 Tax=Puniceicoccus vermicola TaxID=388746 RepID=A0A7X1E412_9BACT|nr:hypothetical protein [Puniceicoccus vermicola]MBC2601641.1 hypothetical protein [Puniceicoccus vermicola]